MRTEDIVGLSFFLVLFAGIGLLFFGLKKEKQNTDAQHRWVGTGLIVCGVACLFVGAVSLYFVRTSPRPIVEGNIWGVSEPVNSKYNPSFHITDDSGQATLIRCKYDGAGLREGERARVRYVEYNHQLLELTMLTGPTTGWGFKESSGEPGYAVWTLMGVVCGLAGRHQLRKIAPEAPSAS
jgi:hypothetical protein